MILMSPRSAFSATIRWMVVMRSWSRSVSSEACARSGSSASMVSSSLSIWGLFRFAMGVRGVAPVIEQAPHSLLEFWDLRRVVANRAQDIVQLGPARQLPIAVGQAVERAE